MLIFDLKISIPFVNGVKLPTLRKILQYVTPGPMTKETHFLPEDPFNFILCKLSVLTHQSFLPLNFFGGWGCICICLYVLLYLYLQMIAIQFSRIVVSYV